MFIGRFFIKIPVLAIAGIAGCKEDRPHRRRHLPDPHAALRGHAGRAVIVIVGALTFFPALAWGRSSSSSSRGRHERRRPDRRVTRPSPAALRAGHRPARHRRFLPQARPAPSAPQPGHVRGRGRKRPHHRALDPGPRRQGRGPVRASSSRCPPGCGSRCSSPTSPRPWPRGGARPRPNLRKARQDVKAKKLTRPCARQPRGPRSLSARCARATTFWSRPGDMIPADGEVVEGVAIGG